MTNRQYAKALDGMSDKALRAAYASAYHSHVHAYRNGGSAITLSIYQAHMNMCMLAQRKRAA